MDTQSTAMATQAQLREIAHLIPGTEFLYEGGKTFIKINNATRDRFIITKGEEVIEAFQPLDAMIVFAEPLHSHKQPSTKDKNKPRHAEDNEYCESRDGKKTSVNGTVCADCPANGDGDCRYAIEISLSLANRDTAYALKLPRASAMRFRQACQLLRAFHQRHFSQVLWRMNVVPDKSDDGNDFAAVTYQCIDPMTGEELPLKKTTSPTQPKIAASTQPPAPSQPTTTTKSVKQDQALKEKEEPPAENHEQLVAKLTALRKEIIERGGTVPDKREVYTRTNDETRIAITRHQSLLDALIVAQKTATVDTTPAEEGLPF